MTVEGATGRTRRLAQAGVGHRHTAKTLATLTWLLGALTVAGALVPAQRDRLRYLHAITGIPDSASATAGAVTAALGVLLLQLGGALRRRKRRAWQVAVAATALVTVTHLVNALEFEHAAVSLAILALLVAARGEFYARCGAVTCWVTARVGAQLAGGSMLLGLALLWANSGRIAGDPGPADRLRHVVLGLAGIHGPVEFTSLRVDRLVTASLLSCGLLTAFVTAYLALRTSQPRAPLSPDGESRLRELLSAQGARDSLGYFALRRDKSVVWSATGKAAVSYRVVSGVALASGDPIGDPEAWPGAIAGFVDLTRRHAWIPAVIGCSEQGATVWRREAGLDALELGDEAIVDVAGFTLQGRAMRGVRQACARAERAGYTVDVRRAADVAPEELGGLLDAAAAWRGGAVERGFSMALSRLGDPADPDCVVVTAWQAGTLRGLMHFVPWGTDGLSLDLMRRDRSADNGLNEFLIARLIAAAPGLGVRRVSLNFAVFRSALERGSRIGAGPVLRLWRGVLVFVSRWWQIESLYRFNLKFRPSWQPRFLSFPSSRQLPRVALAALEAEAFLVRPRPLTRLTRLARRFRRFRRFRRLDRGEPGAAGR